MKSSGPFNPSTSHPFNSGEAAAILESALAANALNALADDPPTELTTLSPESGKWQPRVPAGVPEGGRYAPMHGGGRAREIRTKGFQDRYGNGNPAFLESHPESNIERGKNVFTRLARLQAESEPHAMYRRGIGWIGVDAGIEGNEAHEWAGGFGIAHILAKHGKEGITAETVAETLQYGEMYRNWEPRRQQLNKRRLTIINGNNVAILSKSYQGRILITDFNVVKGHDKASVEEKIAEYKRGGRYHVKGEND